MSDLTTRGWNGLRLVNTIRYSRGGRPVTTTLCSTHSSMLAEEEDLHGDPHVHVGAFKVGTCEHPNHKLLSR